MRAGLPHISFLNFFHIDYSEADYAAFDLILIEIKLGSWKMSAESHALELHQLLSSFITFDPFLEKLVTSMKLPLARSTLYLFIPFFNCFSRPVDSQKVRAFPFDYVR